MRSPVVASHTRTARSAPPLSRRDPSGDTATQLTALVCARRTMQSGDGCQHKVQPRRIDIRIASEMTKRQTMPVAPHLPQNGRVAQCSR